MTGTSPPIGNRFNVVMTAPTLAAPALALLEQAGCTVHTTPPYPDAPALAALVARVQADAILCRQGRVDASVLAASPLLRIVARHGVGVDEVDLAAAASRGVLVTNAPGSNAAAVAEHALALILALVKDLLPLRDHVSAGGWRGGTTQVRDVSGMRLGLIGFGAIGRRVARLALGFDMAVAAFDPAAPAEAFGTVRRAPDLAALLAGTQVLSLHCPLTPATRHIVDAAALAALSPPALIVNTARGGLIDEAALFAALESGRVNGAALDVFEREPPAPEDPLRRHPRVIATPHVAGVTDQALVTMGVMAAECIVAALTGGTVPPERVVVPARPGQPGL